MGNFAFSGSTTASLSAAGTCGFITVSLKTYHERGWVPLFSGSWHNRAFGELNAVNQACELSQPTKELGEANVKPSHATSALAYTLAKGQPTRFLLSYLKNITLHQ